MTLFFSGPCDEYIDFLLKQPTPAPQNSSMNEHTQFASISDLISVLSGPIQPLQDMMVSESRQSTETNIDTPVDVPINDTNNSLDISNKDIFDLINEITQKPPPSIPDNTCAYGNTPMTNELSTNNAQYAHGNLNSSQFFQPFCAPWFGGYFPYASPSTAYQSNQTSTSSNCAIWGNAPPFNPVHASFPIPQYAGSYNIHQGNPSFAAGAGWAPAMGFPMFNQNMQQGYRGADGHYYSQ